MDEVISLSGIPRIPSQTPVRAKESVSGIFQLSTIVLGLDTWAEGE